MSKKNNPNTNLSYIKTWIKGEGLLTTCTNPSTNEINWQGSAVNLHQINQAFDVAKQEHPDWARTPLKKRIQVVKSFQEQVQKQAEELAQAISQDTGKPLWETRTEIQAVINKIDISIQAYKERCKEIVFEVGQKKSFTRHKAHGIVGVLGPFNFPCHLPNGHIVPALLAGNSVIFKPSEYCPTSSKVMMTCWDKSLLPKGILSILFGGPEVGKTIVEHPILAGLFFTGSYKTGKTLSSYFGRHPEKILALEMGGNNPLVVLDYKDIHETTLLIIQSAFISSGQRCTCARRLILLNKKENVKLLKHLVEVSKKIKIGPYFEDPDLFMGPVISQQAAQTVIEFQAKLIKKGAVPLLKSKILNEPSCFVSPGIIDSTPSKEIPDQEIFGPLLQVIFVNTIQEAIQKANDTKYGLSASILSQKPKYFDMFYHQINAGVINWNVPTTGASSKLPFGGIGSSGNHRPSAWYATDYCAYPTASITSPSIESQSTLPPGLPNQS